MECGREKNKKEKEKKSVCAQPENLVLHAHMYPVSIYYLVLLYQTNNSMASI